MLNYFSLFVKMPYIQKVGTKDFQTKLLSQQLASSPGPEIQSSFGASPPPFLVTPPATQKKRRPFNRRRPPRPDGRPNRPPRPDGRPVNRPQTSVATPPLNSRKAVKMVIVKYFWINFSLGYWKKIFTSFYYILPPRVSGKRLPQ